MAVTIKMSSKKSIDRVIKELKETIENLEKLNDKDRGSN